MGLIEELKRAQADMDFKQHFKLQMMMETMDQIQNNLDSSDRKYKTTATTAMELMTTTLEVHDATLAQAMQSNVGALEKHINAAILSFDAAVIKFEEHWQALKVLDATVGQLEKQVTAPEKLPGS